LDQPIGVGFSNNDGDVFRRRWSEKQLSKDFFNFLTNFMIAHPEFKGRKIFITGESYAGHYIPNIAKFIFD
jgi:carboxypeptidase C (cathepsin A)